MRTFGILYPSIAAAAASLLVAMSVAKPAEPLVPTLGDAHRSLSKMALPWVPNAGQWDASAAFRAQSFAGSVWMTHDGRLVHQFNGPKVASSGDTELGARQSRSKVDDRRPGWVLSERFVGGTVKAVQGVDPQVAKANYFLADKPAAADLQSYGELSLGEVYTGVTVNLKATQANVEKLYTVLPNRNPAVIRMRIEGAKTLSIQPDGSLQAATDNGPIAFTPPIAFQFNAVGEKTMVNVAYDLNASISEYGFTLGDYDRTRPLVIDPLLGSTYLGGGAANDHITAMAIQPASGDVYVTGRTRSSNFPTTVGGAFPVKPGGPSDVFVARLNPGLTSLLGATFFGGNGTEVAYGIAINPNTGNVYIAGETDSSNLPGTAGSPQAAIAVNTGLDGDAFVAVFNGALTALIRTSYHGGAGNEVLRGIVYHPTSQEIYIGGYTTGVNTLPGVGGGAQATSGVGRPDCFVTRFNAALTSRLQSTYFSGNSGDNCEINGLAVHPTSGNLYAVGTTSHANLPGAASGAYPTLPGSGLHAFVTRFNAALTSVLSTSYDGNSGCCQSGQAIAISTVSGDVYTAGYGGVPNVAGSAQSINGAAYISRFPSSLATKTLATYVGGASNFTEIFGLVFNAVNGDLYATGETHSTAWTQASGGIQPTYGGGSSDAFVVRVNSSLTSFAGSTYLGTTGRDEASAIAFNPLNGNIYVAGETVGINFPGASVGYQPALASVADEDGFISAFTPDLSSFGVAPNPFTIRPRLNVGISTLHQEGPILLSGLTALASVSITGGSGLVCASSTNTCSCNITPGNTWVTSVLIGNHYLCVRTSAAAAANTFSESTITVGGYVTKFLTYTGQLFNCTMDVDGDGVYQHTTDGLLLTRALAGFTGSAVTNGLVAHNPPRNTWPLIRTHLNSHCGLNLAQ